MASDKILPNRILVTGSAGFIGFHLSQKLLAQGHVVAGYDNLNEYYDVTLKHARLEQLKNHKNFSFIKADLEDQKTLTQVFKDFNPTEIVHLAAQAGVRYSLENPSAYIGANIQGTLNILEACRAHQPKHLIFASTSSVYGLGENMPFREEYDTDHPVSLYAATKKANEVMAHSYAHLFKIPITGLRFFTVYGPWGRPDMALFLFTKAILAGEALPVFNHGKMKRDFTYVGDIVEIISRLVHKPAQPSAEWDPASPRSDISSAPYRIYNIGNSQPVELMHYINAIEEAVGKKAKMNLLPLQAGDVVQTYADNTAIFDFTGHRPSTPIREGIQKFVDWYRNYYQV